MVVPFMRQVVLDCAHPRPLAEFYRALLGYADRPGDAPPPTGGPDPVGDDYLVIRPDGTAPGAVRQMMHLCLTVPDREGLAAQRDRATALGATLLDDRLDDRDEALLVLADVAGHPSCLYVP